MKITIKIPKKTFKINESIAGTVIVTNTYPDELPAVFMVKLFHDGQKFYAFLTAVEMIPFGTTKFPFKDFGIPAFNTYCLGDDVFFDRRHPFRIMAGKAGLAAGPHRGVAV